MIFMMSALFWLFRMPVLRIRDDQFVAPPEDAISHLNLFPGILYFVLPLSLHLSSVVVPVSHTRDCNQAGMLN